MLASAPAETSQLNRQNPQFILKSLALPQGPAHLCVVKDHSSLNFFYEKDGRAGAPYDAEKIKKSLLDNYIHHEGLNHLKNIALNDRDALKRMESIMNTLPADQQKALQPVLDMRRKKLEAYANPDSKEIEIIYQAQVSQRNAEMKQYEQN